MIILLVKGVIYITQLYYWVDGTNVIYPIFLPNLKFNRRVDIIGQLRAKYLQCR
jgi:hypothetical protein